MKRSTEYLAGAAAAAFMTALLGWLFCLTQFKNGFTAMTMRFLPLTAVLLVIYFADCLLLRREISVAVYAALQLAFLAAAEVVLTRCVAVSPAKTGTLVLMGFFYGCMAAEMAVIAYAPSKESAVVMRFDLSAAMTALLLAGAHYFEIPAAHDALIMCIVSLAAGLLALVAVRAGKTGTAGAVRGSGALGALFLAGVLAAAAALAALISTVFADGVRSVSEGVVHVGGTVVSAAGKGLKWLYLLVERLFIWLSRFAKPVPPELPAEDAAMEMGSGSAEEVLPHFPVPPWAGAAAIVLASLLVIAVLLLLRRHRMGRGALRIQRKQTTVKRENGFSAAVRALFSRLRAAARFRADCLRYRRSAAGLLVWCQRKVPRAERRRDGESGEAFLRRVAEKDGCDRLCELAELVERQFYGSGSGTAVSAELYRCVRHMKFT